MNIYRDLLKLQKIEGSFQRWEEYRREITNKIINSVKCFENIVIFGAGCCNDLDLSLIEKKFDQITLVDIDCLSMKEGLKKYSLVDSDKIKLATIDLLGITENDYLEYSRIIETTLLSSKSSIVDSRSIVDKLTVFSNKINNHKIDLGSIKYKNGIVICLHSQINIYFAEIWNIYCQAFSKTDNLSVIEKIMKMNEEVARKINDFILQNVDGNVYFGFETEIVGLKRRIEGAYQAENDFQKRKASREIEYVDLIQVKWPLKIDCTYNVKLAQIITG